MKGFVLVTLAVLLLVAHVSAFGPGGSSIVRRSSPISHRQETIAENPRGVVSTSSGARSMTMMPIGIPKVAYRMPGSRGGEWVDIYQRLTRERIIFMGSEIDDEMANQIIGVLLVSLVATRTAHFATNKF